MATLSSVRSDVSRHVATVPSVARIKAHIDRQDEDDRVDFETSFLMMVDAWLIGGTSTDKSTLLASARELGTLLTRELISADMDALSGPQLANRLRMAYDTVVHQLTQIVADEFDEFVNHVFNHNKGYPRLTNLAQVYKPLRQRTVATVLEDRLDGFTNTHIGTGRGDSRPVRAQLSSDWATLTDKQKDQVWAELFSTIAMQLKVTGYGPGQFKNFIRLNWAHVRGALRGVIPDADVTQALYDKKLSAIAKGLAENFILAG